MIAKNQNKLNQVVLEQQMKNEEKAICDAHFEIKNIHTRDMLLTGPNDNELYSIFLAPVYERPAPNVALNRSLSTWHASLGNASFSTIHQALNICPIFLYCQIKIWVYVMLVVSVRFTNKFSFSII